jgi:hypothetical protein
MRSFARPLGNVEGMQVSACQRVGKALESTSYLIASWGSIH